MVITLLLSTLTIVSDESSNQGTLVALIERQSEIKDLFSDDIVTITWSLTLSSLSVWTFQKEMV